MSVRNLTTKSHPGKVSTAVDGPNAVGVSTPVDTTPDTRPAGKPERPAGSPLFLHATGRWAKKIRGRLVYFGRGSHADALDLYEQQAADLHAGRVPRSPDEAEGLTVFGLTVRFLETKRLLRDAGELSPRTFDNYTAACKLLGSRLGKHRLVSDVRPDDFEKLRKHMAKTWGPVRLGNVIGEIRVVFSYGYKNGLLDRPMIFGEGFRRPSKKTLRKNKAARGLKMFEAAEIRTMLEQAKQPVRAMILLGINCGFGNTDCGTLPLAALDLDAGFASYPRPKTGIDRRCPLWPETVAALREWLAVRPAPKDDQHAGLVFTTKYGGTWCDQDDRAVSKEMRKLLNKAGINGHRNFYALRHTTQTVGDECGDFLAVRSIMGHASNDIADTYRERITDARLRKVTDHVRAWLFAATEGGER